MFVLIQFQNGVMYICRFLKWLILKRRVVLRAAANGCVAGAKTLEDRQQKNQTLAIKLFIMMQNTRNASETS